MIVKMRRCENAWIEECSNVGMDVCKEGVVGRVLWSWMVVGRVLWEECCGVGWLWEGCCRADVVELSGCGKGVVGRMLWEECCGVGWLWQWANKVAKMKIVFE